MQSKITKRLVDSLKTEATDYYVFDTETIGFAVRVRATGGMSYIVQYKVGKGRGAPTRRVSLGPVGRMTPDQARTAARNVLGDVGQGHDAATDRDERRLTFAEIADNYLRDHAAKRKGSTNAWVASIVERVIKPALGKMNPSKITRQDVARLHSSLRNARRSQSCACSLAGAVLMGGPTWSC